MMCQFCSISCNEIKIQSNKTFSALNIPGLTKLNKISFKKKFIVPYSCTSGHAVDNILNKDIFYVGFLFLIPSVA